MRKLAVVAAVIGLSSTFVQVPAAEEHAAKKAPPGFAQIKSLAGEWEGKTPDGKVVHLSYKVASSGTAVVETLSPPDEMDMVTVYHADGDSILMTHYCASNNQPRMRARVTSENPKEIAFNYLDATNLSSPSEGHMTALTLTFDDPTHLSQAWTWTGEGGGKPEVFRFQRKK